MKRRSATTERRERGRLPPRQGVAGGVGRGQGRPKAVYVGFQLAASMFHRGAVRAENRVEQDVSRIEAEVRGLMQSGDVGKARRLLADLDPVKLADARLARWARALAPPKLRVGAPGSTASLEKNAAWLRENAAAHLGRWVALRDGELLGSDPDHVALHRELERRGELRGAVFVRVANG